MKRVIKKVGVNNEYYTRNQKYAVKPRPSENTPNEPKLARGSCLVRVPHY